MIVLLGWLSTVGGGKSRFSVMMLMLKCLWGDDVVLCNHWA